MKILLSAYACEPNKGSEPAVGWNWAIELARLGHEVHVVTRDNNRENILHYLDNSSEKLNLHFAYVGLPKWLTFWKRKTFGVHQYYFLWQIAAYLYARKLHQAIGFDKVHHVTFVSVRQPSFMGLLGIPFIFGPVAGGDIIPVSLRKSLPVKARLYEYLRDIANWMARFDPFMHLTFHSASKIYVNSEQTRAIVPKRFQDKTEIKLAIAVNSPSFVERSKPRENLKKILYVGNLLHLKGVHLAIKAFARVLKTHPDSTLTIIGEGPQEAWLKGIAMELGLGHTIRWLNPMPREELLALYHEYDLFLFPSLRDSGGLVVLEAMATGLPVVALKLGGPGVIVDDSCGMAVDAISGTEEDIVQEMYGAINDLFAQSQKYVSMSSGAMVRAQEMSWLSHVVSIMNTLHR